jgi:hypothetical protein
LTLRLCQRPGASCGACCGLYNAQDHGREAAAPLLRRRTELLRRTEKTLPAFRAAAARLAAEGPAPLFHSVRVCPLLGYLDAAETRVGCLAHPLANGGVELRAAGAYDVMTCEMFLCPSHAWLTEEEAALCELACAVGGADRAAHASTGARGPAAAAGMADWHLYGLVITDVPFLRACLGAVAALTGARVEARHLEQRRFHEALARLLALKQELAPGSDGLFGAFKPGRDGGEVPRRIDYEALARNGSPYDTILTCAGADPRSGNDLDELEGEVRRRLEGCGKAFALPAAPRR